MWTSATVCPTKRTRKYILGRTLDAYAYLYKNSDRIIRPATNKYSDVSKYRAADVVFTLFAPNPGPIDLLQPKTARELNKIKKKNQQKQTNKKLNIHI